MNAVGKNFDKVTSSFSRRGTIGPAENNEMAALISQRQKQIKAGRYML